MRAWVAERHGHYSQVLSYQDQPDPKAAGADAVIAVRAIGMNFPDILAVAGKYQVRAEPPFVPGQEAAGEVVETGPESSFRVGDRVMCLGPGAFAEYMTAPGIASFRVPDYMSDADAAAFQMTYQTSYFALVVRARIQPGETLLVHGAAGGVGTSAVQLGKLLGARVIGTAGSAEKLDVARRCGADDVINYEQEDWVAKVKELTDGRGADVIYDPVGGEVAFLSTKCIAWNGRLLVIGFTSGTIQEIPANRILLKNMSMIGVFWGAYRIHEPHLIVDAQRRLYGWYETGKIRPVISREFALDDIPEALEAIEKRESYGKVIVRPGRISE